MRKRCFLLRGHSHSEFVISACRMREGKGEGEDVSDRWVAYASRRARGHVEKSIHIRTDMVNVVVINRERVSVVSSRV